ncbi:IS3 family transposase [Rhodococcus sp. NPDC059968]|uniref:IS3 family transposase n=1 Tax=Rhodococcus sp. NPDC059968 TaxID=3347017 RepID=UPI00366AB3DB
MVHARSPFLAHTCRILCGFSHDAHHHGSFSAATRGGLAPAPAYRCRRTYLHLHNSTTITRLRLLHRYLTIIFRTHQRPRRGVQQPLQAELIRNKGPWHSINDVEIAVAEYVDWFNERRLHGELGQVPPAEFAVTHAANLAQTPLLETQITKALPIPELDTLEGTHGGAHRDPTRCPAYTRGSRRPWKLEGHPGHPGRPRRSDRDR